MFENPKYISYYAGIANQLCTVCASLDDTFSQKFYYILWHHNVYKSSIPEEGKQKYLLLLEILFDSQKLVCDCAKITMC